MRLVFLAIDRPHMPNRHCGELRSVAGLLGTESLAASDLTNSDLYIEEIFDFAGTKWSQGPTKQVILISSKAIRHIEFIASPWEHQMSNKSILTAQNSPRPITEGYQIRPGAGVSQNGYQVSAAPKPTLPTVGSAVKSTK